MPSRGSTTRSVTNQIAGVYSTTIIRMNHQLPVGFIVQPGSTMRAASWVKPNSSTSSWPGVTLPANPPATAAKPVANPASGWRPAAA